MMGYPREPVYPPTARSQNLVKILRYLLYIQLGLAVFKMFSGFLSSAFSDLLACWILYQAYSRLDVCSTIIYIFFNGITVFQIFLEIATKLQNGKPLFSDGSAFGSMILYLSLVFYIVSIYYVFEAYKEFKAISLDLVNSGGIDLPQYRPPPRAQNAGSGKKLFNI